MGRRDDYEDYDPNDVESYDFDENETIPTLGDDNEELPTEVTEEEDEGPCDHKKKELTGEDGSKYLYCKHCDEYTEVNTGQTSSDTSCKHRNVSTFDYKGKKHGQCKDCGYLIDVDEHKAKGLKTLG